MATKAASRGSGRVRTLPARRYRASYVGPDTDRHNAPFSFGAKDDAERWLESEKGLISAGAWTPPAARSVRRAVTFGEYSAAWLADRALTPRTRHHYARMLENHINPTFDTVPLRDITPHKVRAWHDSLDTSTPTVRAHAYGLLRTILGGAAHDGEIPASPARIRGADNARRTQRIRPASLPELEVLTAAIPQKYRLMVMLAAWCGLRFGELTELRRGDIDTESAIIHVRRAVVQVNGEFIVDKPRIGAETRDLSLPPHLLPMVRDHLTRDITGGRNGLLFPAADGRRHLAPSTFYKSYHPARDVAGRPDLTFHELRHTGALLAGSTGATLAELMGRLDQASDSPSGRDRAGSVWAPSLLG